MDWKQLKEKVYYRDGSLRDIYTADITRADWQQWVDFVNRVYSVRWYNSKTGNDEDTINFSVIDEYFSSPSCTLSPATVFIHGLQISAHFFTDREFENDIDPKEFNTIDDHTNLLNYMNEISKLFDKKVALTPENSAEHPLLEVYKGTVTLF